MIELHDGMLLYHGGYISIPEIDLNRCFGGLDFGRGFYLTSSYEPAYHYVQLSVRKAIRIGSVPEDFDPNDGQISASFKAAAVFRRSRNIQPLVCFEFLICYGRDDEEKL